MSLITLILINTHPHYILLSFIIMTFPIFFPFFGKKLRDSWMYSYQRTPVGNPCISPISRGYLSPLESLENTINTMGYTQLSLEKHVIRTSLVGTWTSSGTGVGTVVSTTWDREKAGMTWISLKKDVPDRKLGTMVRINGLFHQLFINGLYIGVTTYNPLILTIY